MPGSERNGLAQLLPDDRSGARWWPAAMATTPVVVSGSGCDCAPWAPWMLLLGSTSECLEDDVDWAGITNLAEVVGSYVLPGFSGSGGERGGRRPVNCSI